MVALQRVCIVGGGNIGTATCCDLARNPQLEVVLFTSNPKSWNQRLRYIDGDTAAEYEVQPYLITNNLVEALQSTQLVFITLPAFLVEGFIAKAEPLLAQNTILCFLPGFGGKEFYCSSLAEQGHIIAGVDRVPYIARIQQQGVSVRASKKPSLRCATLPSKDAGFVAQELAALFQIPCEALSNYLTVTFTPSNPLLHTARLYSLFKDYQEGDVWSANCAFYAQWSEEASQVLLSMDNELQTLCRAFWPLDLSGVIPLSKHYESEDAASLTRKIRSIASLKEIMAPMRAVAAGWIPNKESRYFVEDIPHGLMILRGFAELAQRPTPSMDRVLRWYERFAGLEYFQGTELTGASLSSAVLPQAYGLNTVADVVDFYSAGAGTTARAHEETLL
jgi:hypothetical protein